MTNQDVTALVDTFRWLTNPEAGPEAGIRNQLRLFMEYYLESKGSEGGFLEEGEEWLVESINGDPAIWIISDLNLQRVKELWRQVWLAGNRLPPLEPSAQAVWLGTEMNFSNEIIDAALHQLFPTATPPEVAKAYRRVSQHLNAYAREMNIQAVVLKAWGEIERARGRDESELTFGKCAAALGIIVKRDDGGSYIDWNNLTKVSDPELRHACVAAAWTAMEAEPE